METKVWGCLLAAAMAFAAGPADGTYRGTGHWEGRDGSSGTCAVETTVRGATIDPRSTYEVEGKQQVQALDVSPGGGLQVVDGQGNAIGSASCLGEECLLQYDAGPVKLVETVRTCGGRLENFGTKAGPGFAVVYSSTLTAN